MALNSTLTITREGFEGALFRNNCYVVINTITGSKTGLKVTYYYKEGPEGTVLSQGDFSFVPDVEGENYHEQAYRYMKSRLVQFSEAVDC